ncbi:hypothetical protein CERSUDRAFT_45721 [Gelatoporia subvermispora B]|uniref:DUF6534 domain-containing protein n=1 Tax=Ceriporiopsis subvermispora (strain B) TaxID=914234 RepID=M2RNR6_CERS8|nr:hypothetical protein CERSUDRAFT_45721 [Gelatoporia subvermispora B]
MYLGADDRSGLHPTSPSRWTPLPLPEPHLTASLASRHGLACSNHVRCIVFSNCRGFLTPIRYGPILIGTVFNIMLYGIMVTQTFLYFTVYTRDKLWMKSFVCLLFLCDTLNSAFDIAFIYVPLVNKFGIYFCITQHTNSTLTTSQAIIALQVQLFFAWRVKVLTGSVTAVTVIAVCSLVQFLGGLGTAIAVGMIPEFVQFQRFKSIRKHRTGFAATDDVVNRIIRMTVQTGLITALCAIVDLIAYLSSSSGLHLVFNIPLAKLYTNSLMSSLNSRAGWRYGSSQSAALHHVDGSLRSESSKDRQSDMRRPVSIAASRYGMVRYFARRLNASSVLMMLR